MKRSEDMHRVLNRFYDKVEVQENGCWYWLGALPRENPYGRFYMFGREDGAHRASYLLHVGAIPEGHEIDHLCKLPFCVNPDHLEAVTQAENALRSSIGTSWALHKAQKCAQGHDVTGDNAMRRTKTSGRVSYRCRICWNGYNRKQREAKRR